MWGKLGALAKETGILVRGAAASSARSGLGLGATGAGGVWKGVTGPGTAMVKYTGGGAAAAGGGALVKRGPMGMMRGGGSGGGAGGWSIRGIWGGMGRVGRRAAVGAGVGGAWGMASDDTSVLGGMAIGAGLGAGSFYGQAGFTTGRALSSNMPLGRRVVDSGAMAMDMAIADAKAGYHGARMAASRAINSMGPTLKNWRGQASAGFSAGRKAAGF